MFFSNINPESGPLTFNKENFVDDSFIEKVNSYIKTQELIQGGIVDTPGKIKLKDDVRRSEIHWMVNEKYKDDLVPLYVELTAKMREVNFQYWNWIIDSWDAFQYTEYDESYKGHYDWHIDYGYKEVDQPLSRKISFSLGISDKNDYEGGELVTKTSENDIPIKLDKGEIFIFPSWMLHKVTPVTKGKRKVVVGWGIGPVV